MDKIVNSKNSKTQVSFILLLLSLAVGVLLLASLLFGFLPDKRLTINNQKIDVIVADSSDERAKGLSGRDRLNDREGMLFIFSDESQYCIWMKDMKFTIDIIWLNESKEVIDIKKKATPESYPESFCPSESAKYVLEISSDKAKQWDIKAGDRALF